MIFARPLTGRIAIFEAHDTPEFAPVENGHIEQCAHARTRKVSDAKLRKNVVCKRLVYRKAASLGYDLEITRVRIAFQHTIRWVVRRKRCVRGCVKRR